MDRRGLLLGLGASLVTAPSIVHFESLMPVRTMLADRIVIDDHWFEIGHDTADINTLLPKAYEKYSYAWVNNRLFAKGVSR